MSGVSRKRSRPSAEDANNSFVMSVTSKVTGLLPATITKWFSGSSQTNSNGSAPTAEITDSSSEDEPEPASPITQPPQKRIRYNTPNNYNSSEANSVTYNNETAETSYSAGLGPSSQLKKFGRDPNMVSTPFRPSNEETPADRSERDSNKSNSSFSYSTLGPPVLNKRKSLFKTLTSNDESISVKPSHNNSIVDPKQPCFKPSLLVSPFYPSRTTYGGASSQYINRPNIKQRKGTYVNELNSNESTTMSHSARRVMDLLEDYSSPINEAKRIPQYTLPRKDPIASSSLTTSNNNKTLSYKTTEFQPPNIASILRLKQKSRLMNTTNAARQIIASHSSACHYSPYTMNPRRSQTDVDARSKCVGTTSDALPQVGTQSKNEEDKETTLPPVSLPTVVLQINKDNMPKFTFGTNLPNPDASSTPKPLSSKTDKIPIVPESVTSIASKTTISKPEAAISKHSVNTVNTFKFSTPVKISFTMGSPQVVTTPPKYTFGTPECGVDEGKTDKSNCVVGEKDVQNDIAKPKNWKCSDCWVMNKTDVDKCVCCGGKKPSSDGEKTAKCSVCKLANSQPHVNKCVNCEKVPTSVNFNSTPLTNSVKSLKWKCSECWVENDDNQDKCVCCGSKNPKKSTQSAPAAIAKAADSDWTCNDCWIKNKSNIEKCVACGGSKPGSKQNATPALSTTPSTSFKPTDNKTFKPLVVTQSKKWECTSCLVRNDNDKVKCVCCDTERPGAEKTTVKTTFNFGSTNNSFKFGIDPKVQEANLAKAPEIKPLETKVEESETNNNVLSKAPPTFSFGIPPKKPEDQTDSPKNKIPASLTESPFVQKAAMFTVPDFTAKKPETKEDDEKPQEVPKVEFSLPVPVSKPELPFGTMLGASPLTSTSNAIPSSTPSLLNSTTNMEKKDTPAAQLPFQLGSVTTTAATPTQNKFVFSGTGLKPAMNLFAKPASSSPTTSISFAPPAQTAPTTTGSSLFQKPPEPASTPAMSLFQKSETNTNSALSLFQKPTAATTAAAPSLASTAPVFSFGTGTKPSSTFNFGATQPASMNEPTTNNSFKFFGSTPDKNTSTNKFNIGGVTNLGAVNSLTSGNILGSGNGLSTGNTLGNTSLTGANTLTSGNTEMPVQSNQNDLQAGNSMQSPPPSIFGAPAQKENIWSQPGNSSSNLFGANATNSLPKPGAFTFGSSSTPFSAQSSNPAPSSTPFSAQPNPTPSNTPFSVQPNSAASSTPFSAQPNTAPSSTPFSAQPSNPAPAPVFGSNSQPTQNLFGMGNQNSNSNRSLFSSPVQSQPAPSMFGASQPTSTPSVMGMFGSPSVGSTSTFGTPNQSMPTFDSSSINPAPAPAFNFGAPPSQSPVVFGFGQQQQQQQQPQQQPIYNFGASTNSPQLNMGAAPQVQFSMGSAPAMRRVRKAVRRNTPR